MLSGMLKPINKLFIAIIGFSLIYMTWVFYSGKATVLETNEVNKIFSQFKMLEGADEYVLAKLVSNEEFIKNKYNNVFVFGDKYPIGDTTVKLSLVAHYNYYAKLAELKLSVENDKVIIYIPRLYLSSPVAFELSTLREDSQKFLFGDNEKSLLDQQKSEIPVKLIDKGQAEVGAMYDKAAKALADNFNSYFKANGYGSYYKSIVVNFNSEAK